MLKCKLLYASFVPIIRNIPRIAGDNVNKMTCMAHFFVLSLNYTNSSNLFSLVYRAWCVGCLCTKPLPLTKSGAGRPLNRIIPVSWRTVISQVTYSTSFFLTIKVFNIVNRHPSGDEHFFPRRRVVLFSVRVNHNRQRVKGTDVYLTSKIVVERHTHVKEPSLEDDTILKQEPLLTLKRIVIAYLHIQLS